VSRDARNLLFVGGYGHPPNEDAVHWFHDKILPLIVEKHPGVQVHLVGGGAGRATEALASEVTTLHGRIDDEALQQAYKMADIAVVPLRFGAGVKGKVVEAMANGLPVVTTDIGAEGIESNGCPLVIGNTPQEIAARINALLADSSARNSLAEQGQKFVLKNFSRARAAQILQKDFAWEKTVSKTMEESC
jgi:glycosyltransferase involved in cell wall biosynthesis